MLAQEITDCINRELNLNYGALYVAIRAERYIPSDVALKLVVGVSLKSEGVKAYRNRRKWSKEDLEDMNQLRSQGYTYNSIGEIFGVDGTSIYKYLKRHGLLVKGIKGARRYEDE